MKQSSSWRRALGIAPRSLSSGAHSRLARKLIRWPPPACCPGEHTAWNASVRADDDEVVTTLENFCYDVSKNTETS